MGDMGDVFRDMRKHGQEKRARNRLTSAELLEKNGFSFTSHNDGAHLIVTHGAWIADFWPGTGRWAIRNQKKSFGVESLMVALGRLYCPDRGCPTNRERIELGAASHGDRGPTSDGGSWSTISHHPWATHWMPLPEPPK